MDGRKTKVPYSAKFQGRASSTNPETWSSFSQAKSKLSSEYSGLGFVLSEASGIIFIDIDGCLCGGILDDRALDILGVFGGRTFVEVSQSGEGLHIFAFGVIPRSFKNPSNGVEMYSGKRYCAMTGNMLPVSSLKVSQEQVALDYVFQKYKTPERTQVVMPSSGRSLSLSDVEIIEKAKRNELFSRLWAGEFSMYAGDGESGHHIADLVLCTKLAFWTDRDRSRMDSLFRSSGLYREKWNRSDYREHTLEEACGRCEESVSEYAGRHKSEEVDRLEKYFSSVW